MHGSVWQWCEDWYQSDYYGKSPVDVKPVGEGVSELRIDYGPGYRVYFVQRGQVLVVLLAGGDKRTQDRDIQTALKLAREL
jgi:putative addiction module killer protein